METHLLYTNQQAVKRTESILCQPGVSMIYSVRSLSQYLFTSEPLQKPYHWRYSTRGVVNVGLFMGKTVQPFGFVQHWNPSQRGSENAKSCLKCNACDASEGFNCLIDTSSASEMEIVTEYRQSWPPRSEYLIPYLILSENRTNELPVHLHLQILKIISVTLLFVLNFLWLLGCCFFIGTTFNLSWHPCYFFRSVFEETYFPHEVWLV